MNRWVWFIRILVVALYIAWCSKLHDYFYGLSPSEQVSLLLVAIASILVSLKLPISLKKTHEWWVVIALITLPFTLFPLLIVLIPHTEMSWLVLPAFLFLMTLGACLIHQKVLQGVLFIAMGVVFVYPYDFDITQKQFYDHLVDEHSTRKADAQLVKWKDGYWLYYDSQLQYATVDKHVYGEAFVQPVMQLIDSGAHVLLLGGDNGLIESELSKFQNEISLTIVPWDSSFNRWVRSNEYLDLGVLQKKNQTSEQDLFQYLLDNPSTFDVIFVDVPDPSNLEYIQFYSLEFYEICSRSLKNKGLLVVQTGDVFKDRRRVNKIKRTAINAGFELFSYNCQIPTIGQWSWFIGTKSERVADLRKVLSQVKDRTTRWWNQDAMNLMMNEGKSSFYMDEDTTVFSMNDVKITE